MKKLEIILKCQPPVKSRPEEWPLSNFSWRSPHAHATCN